jgi:phospholipid transport system substrate-binding protein
MRKNVILIILGMFLGASSYAYGAGPLDIARDSVNGVLDILKDPLYKDNAKKDLQMERIRAKIRDVFDFGETAKRTLGRNRKRFTSEQQVEFTDIFSEFLQKIYIKRIQGYTDEKIIYLSENMTSKLMATVKTKIVTKVSEIPIDYRMIMKKEGWKIYDVNIEGVSLVRNYRTQFQRILIKESPQELIERVKRKVRTARKNEFAKANES